MTATAQQRVDANPGDYRPGIGGCPDCGSPGELRNVGKENWFRCPDCKTKWPVGWGLFGEPTIGQVRARNEAILAQCRLVEPLLPTVFDRM